jgi:hypothetical protein
MWPSPCFPQEFDQSIAYVLIAAQPFDFELTKSLDDLPSLQDGHGIEDHVRLTSSTQLNTYAGSPRTQG